MWEKGNALKCSPTCTHIRKRLVAMSRVPVFHKLRGLARP
jgi:hypothetical protein